jgi:hypothetical protein
MRNNVFANMQADIVWVLASSRTHLIVEYLIGEVCMLVNQILGCADSICTRTTSRVTLSKSYG